MTPQPGDALCSPDFTLDQQGPGDTQGATNGTQPPSHSECIFLLLAPFLLPVSTFLSRALPFPLFVSICSFPSLTCPLLPATSKPLGGFDSSPELFLPQLYQACRAAHGTIKHLIRSLRNDTSFSLICSKSLRSPEFLHTYYFTCASSYPTSSGWPVSESLNDR